MKLRSLCAAIIITMLCAPFMAKAGLEELKAAVGQAQIAAKKAIDTAQPFILVSPSHFYFVKGYAECAQAAVQAAEKAAERLATAKAAYNAALEEHNAKRKLAMNEILTIADALDDDDEEDDSDTILGTATAMMQQDDAIATLTWQDGRETEMFGVLQIYNDGAVTFVGQPAEKIT